MRGKQNIMLKITKSLFAFTLLCATALGAQETPPDLVVFIAVDQLRGDYLDRFEPNLSGGLLRLKKEGAHFANAFQDHGLTVTAVGHASMLSGRFPRSTGILTNGRGVPDPAARSTEGTSPSASPFRFRGTVLFDWMRMHDPLSRALSVSAKDRGAILPLGRAQQDVYWYSSSGNFITSNYYRDTLPTWVNQFNALRIPEKYAGRTWTLLKDPSAYPEAEGAAALAKGQPSVFPHTISSDPKQAVRQLTVYPWMDELTLQFALAGVDALNLGRNGHTDMLSVSLSMTDAIGHTYGPDSRELHDQILRLDLALGAFLDSLFKRVPREKVVLALTADHGVTPFPKAVARDSAAAAALGVSLNPAGDKAREFVKQRGYQDNDIVLEGGMITFGHKLWRNTALRDTVTDLLARELRAIRGVERVDYVRDLPKGDTINDTITRRWLHMIPPDAPVPLVVTLKDLHVFGSTSASHGSPRDRDAHVPILFYGPPFKSGRYTEFARTVDIAATLAHVLGISPSETLDGKVLHSALRK